MGRPAIDYLDNRTDELGRATTAIRAAVGLVAGAATLADQLATSAELAHIEEDARGRSAMEETLNHLNGMGRELWEVNRVLRKVMGGIDNMPGIDDRLRQNVVPATVGPPVGEAPVQ